MALSAAKEIGAALIAYVYKYIRLYPSEVHACVHVHDLCIASDKLTNSELHT